MGLEFRFPESCAVVAGFSCVACVTADIDTTDRQASHFELRVRKELDDPENSHQVHLEGAWTRANGSTSKLDYTIHTVNAGVGFESSLGTEGWSSVAVGGSLQRTYFDSGAAEISGDSSFGPYVAVEGGWHATPTVEPFARVEGALYIPDFSTMFTIEVGARFHFVEHGAFFAGWRYGRYDARNLEDFFEVEQVELDASGFVFGLNFAF